MKTVFSRRYLFIFLCLFPFASVGEAAFQFTNLASRANGMGGAFTGLADDGGAPLYNPAGLRQILRKNVSFSYIRPYTRLQGIDLNFMYMNYTHPLKDIGSFGLTVMRYDGDGIYGENLISLTYAARLNDFLIGLETENFVGVNLKFLSRNYNWDEETKRRALLENDQVILQGDPKAGFTLDLGYLVRISRAMYGGVSVLNLTQPDVGIKHEDRVPLKLKAGFSLRDIIGIKSLKGSNITFDASFRNQKWGSFSDKFNVHAGMEFLFENFGVRTGINSNNFSFGGSYSREINDNLEIGIDYSVLLPFRVLGGFETHNLSLSLKIGQMVQERKIDTRAVESRERIIREIFKEEPEGEEKMLQRLLEIEEEIEKETEQKPPAE